MFCISITITSKPLKLLASYFQHIIAHNFSMVEIIFVLPVEYAKSIMGSSINISLLGIASHPYVHRDVICPVR